MTRTSPRISMLVSDGVGGLEQMPESLDAYEPKSGTPQTFPRIHVRLNAAGRYDAYLIRASFAAEIWVSSGPDIAGALWWVKQAPTPVTRCCGAA